MRAVISCGVLSAVLLAGCDRLTSQPAKPDAPKSNGGDSPHLDPPKSAPATKAKAKTPPTVKKADVVRVTAEDLWRELQTDNVAFAGRYAGKRLRITLTVSTVTFSRTTADVMWNPMPGWDTRFIGATVPVADAAGLKTGSVFVAEGEVVESLPFCFRISGRKVTP